MITKDVENAIRRIKIFLDGDFSEYSSPERFQAGALIEILMAQQVILKYIIDVEKA